MAKRADADDSQPHEGRLRWVLGWIVLPVTLISALFFAGVHVGARHPDMGLSRVLLKLFGAEPGVADVSKAVTHEPRPGTHAGPPFTYADTISAAQLRTIAEKSLVPSIADLPCEDVCRAWSMAHYYVAVYSIEECKLARSLNTAPGFLTCRGKLEAVDSPPPK
jgi:hypothetical protein